jgi:magnesium-transporting ATPase (P-type)
MTRTNLEMKGDDNPHGHARLPTQEEEDESSTIVPFHSFPIDHLLRTLQTDLKVGLSQQEVGERFLKHGFNIFPEKPGPTLLDRLIEQLHSPLIYVLLAGAVISVAFHHYADGVVIVVVVMVNVAMGLWMESKADRTTKALKGMLSQTATVRRDDDKEQIDAKFFTVGDIFYLQAGDIVPADGRVINSSELSIMEAALTGESHAILKTRDPCPEDSPLSERTCMVYSGTQVLKGSAVCVVTSIGVHCEIGKINSMLDTVVNQKTPLVIELEKLGYNLSGIILFVSAVALAVALLRGYSVKDSFAFAIGVTVAAMPEGLPSCVTITFAVGVRAMASHRAIVKSLPAAETLGSVSVICSDKTGTLTKNEMVVRMLCTENQCFDVKEDGKLLQSGGGLTPVILNPTLLFQYLSPGFYCNDSSISLENQSSSETDSESSTVRYKVLGDPTESAILNLGITVFGPEKIQSICRRAKIEELPFDSTNKFMAALHEVSSSHFNEIFGRSSNGNSHARSIEEDQEKIDEDSANIRVVFVKGAPERVIDFCDLSEASKNSWRSQAMLMAGQGMRVLGCAWKVIPRDTNLVKESSNGFTRFTMSCLVGIADPPRQEAIHAIESAHNAGITVKMITGDHPLTARTIGMQLGLQSGTHTAVTGADLDALIANNDLTTFDEIVRNNNIFARTSPEHKLLIVQSLQRQQISCSMTGDGVNDAPALKQANIGVAMGITGTEVAKDASHIIITDDNFATIVEAIRYGRCTYGNLVKILIFVLPTNAAQASSIIVALIIGVDVPLTALQILWVNMITSITLGLILAFETPNERIMKSPPRRSGKAIFGKFLSWRVLFVATLLVVAVLGNYHWEQQRIKNTETLRTIAVNTLSVGQLFYLFNCRNLRHNEAPWNLLFGNSAMVFGIMAVFLAQGLFTYSSAFHYLFKTKSLDALAWGKMVLLGFIIFLVVEAEKAFTEFRLKSKTPSDGNAHQQLVPGTPAPVPHSAAPHEQQDATATSTVVVIDEAIDQI